MKRLLILVSLTLFLGGCDKLFAALSTKETEPKTPSASESDIHRLETEIEILKNQLSQQNQRISALEESTSRTPVQAQREPVRSEVLWIADVTGDRFLPKSPFTPRATYASDEECNSAASSVMASIQGNPKMLDDDIQTQDGIRHVHMRCLPIGVDPR